MALFDTPKNKDANNKSYIALLDKNEDLAAFITPVKGISQELLVENLQSLGLKCRDT